MAATVATAFSVDFVSFAVCRFVTGIGIGGEHAAINSAIDELIPARVRGRVSLAINGSFWIGAALGAAFSLVLLDPAVLGPQLGWRAGFLLGALLAVAILLVRRHVPESPRWLISRGRIDEAERIVAAVEASVIAETGQRLPPPGASIALTLRTPPLREVAQVLLHRYPRRSALVLALMISQASFYNAIFFTYALVLTRFHGIAGEDVALYIFRFALGNVLGRSCSPAVRSRRPPTNDRCDLRAVRTRAARRRHRVHAGASRRAQPDARLVSSVFPRVGCGQLGLPHGQRGIPLEMRALSISIFYAVGTGAGGFAAPALFGMLIETGSRANVFIGYAIGAALVLVAAAVAWYWAVDAERRPLEDIAAPLGAAEQINPTRAAGRR